MEEKQKCGYFPELYDDIEVYRLPDPKEAMELYGATEDNNPSFIQEIYYSELLEQGFRRSHALVYRNTCPHCKKCKPLRIKADEFVLTKSQRHSIRKNMDITTRLVKAPEDMICDQKVEMYRQYMEERNDSRLTKEEAREHLINWNGIIQKDSSSSLFYKGTVNLDYYLGDKLIGCSILDQAADRISSAYFYYSTDEEVMKRGLGPFSILNEIFLCQQNNYTYYDLGYWIEDCQKMKYKANFMPHEILVNGEWIKREK